MSLWISLGLSAAGALASDFAERWIVVLSSHKDREAARNALASSSSASLLVSDDFAGLKLGYVLVVLGPFEDRALAEVARGASGVKDAYLRFTGATRGAGSTSPPTAERTEAGTSAPSAQAEPACGTHRCWNYWSLTQPVIAALEAWEKAERNVPGRTGYEILDVMRNNNGNSAIVLEEKRQLGKSCERGYRELDLRGDKTGWRVVPGREVGYRCCDGSTCERRDPASFMLRLLESRDVRWAIHPKKGVVLWGSEYDGKTFHRERAQVTLPALIDFNPLYDSFECPESWKDDAATCWKWTGGEGSEFRWRRTDKGAFLEEFEITYQEQ